jgi:hypothetical protein
MKLHANEFLSHASDLRTGVWVRARREARSDEEANQPSSVQSPHRRRFFREVSRKHRKFALLPRSSSLLPISHSAGALRGLLQSHPRIAGEHEEETKMKQTIIKLVMAALVAVTATYAGMSAGSARGDMSGTGGMTGAGDGSGSMTGTKPK